MGNTSKQFKHLCFLIIIINIFSVLILAFAEISEITLFITIPLIIICNIVFMTMCILFVKLFDSMEENYKMVMKVIACDSINKLIDENGEENE